MNVITNVQRRMGREVYLLYLTFFCDLSRSRIQSVNPWTSSSLMKYIPCKGFLSDVWCWREKNKMSWVREGIMSCCKYHLKSLYDIKLTVLRQKIYLLFDGDIQLLRKIWMAYFDIRTINLNHFNLLTISFKCISW